MPSMPDVIILCGGAGVRLRSITAGEPKSMMSIGGRPFMELQLRQLRRHGFQRVILAVGYRGEVVCSAFGKRAFGLHLEYSAEDKPLGTGGALRNAVKLVESASVLLMNGDSYTGADLKSFLEAHIRTKADASIVVVPADGREDCGFVVAAEDGRLVRFNEKEVPVEARYVNAGIYILSHGALLDIPPGCSISLEREVLPRWLTEGKNMRVFVQQAKCIDIGTPERYMSAQRLLAGVESDHETPGRAATSVSLREAT